MDFSLAPTGSKHLSKLEVYRSFIDLLPDHGITIIYLTHEKCQNPKNEELYIWLLLNT